MMSKNSFPIVKDLLKHIETFAPSSISEEWDNVGLMVGSYNSAIHKIAVCLDAVSDSVIEADKIGCNVLLTHHPLIFRGIKKINIDSEIGKTISEAIKRNINIIAVHTNWDKAEEGVNATLAELLNLSDCEVLDKFGIIGNTAERISVKNFAEFVKKAWNLSEIEVYSDSYYEKISRVAICGGSGAEFWRTAENLNADIYLTADMKYHELIDSTRAGLIIGLSDHGEMERASISKLAEKISDFGITTEILNVKALKSPFRI